MTPGSRSSSEASFNFRRTRRREATLLLAAALSLAACSGGGSDGPSDTTPPTVVITDDVAAVPDVATGNVTFSFTFSEDVGSSFVADDVAVTGGTKGTFTRIASTLYHLVVRPPADTTGTITVTVAAGKFTDLAGNANAAPATATQDFVTPPAAFSTVTFDDPAVTYTLTGFGGADPNTLEADPAGGSNTVVKVVKQAAAETWAGTTFSTGANLTVGQIPFDASNTRMTVRVYAPAAGLKVRLKAEDAATGSHHVETEATTASTSAWETLTFDFAHQASSTPALDLAATYDKVSIFFDFGSNGTERVCYFDDVTFIGGGGVVVAPAFANVTFDDAGVSYSLVGFGGVDGGNSVVAADPVDAANQVGKVFRPSAAELWAGTTVVTGANNAVGKIPFAAGKTVMTVRVYAPATGLPVRLKVEDTATGSHHVETEATTTSASAWETLTFDFSSPATGTDAIDFANTYDKLSVFFDFGALPGTAGDQLWYFDDVTFVP